MKFQKSEVFQQKVKKDFNNIKKKILNVSDAVEVLQIGDTAIPGALTKGDLDVQVRVNKKSFSSFVKEMDEFFEPNNLWLWNSNFAIFKDTSYVPKIDILVTVIGSKDDNLQDLQELLKNDVNLLREYNDLKLKYGDSELEEYKIAKRKFYNKLRKLVK